MNVLHILQDISLKQHTMTSDTLNPKSKKKTALFGCGKKKLNSVSPNQLLVNVLHIVQDISLKQHKMTSNTLNPKQKKKTARFGCPSQKTQFCFSKSTFGECFAYC